MLRGELHNRGTASRCEACGEIFPCPTGLAIYEAVKRELEHPTPPPPPTPATTSPAIAPPLYSPRWEDLPDREDRCLQCLHWWVSHGSEPDPDGCGMIESSMAERTAMADHDRELRRQGVPPEVAGPRAYRELRYCRCLERPAPGSEWEKRLAREAAYQAQHYDRRRGQRPDEEQLSMSDA
jgi:hypothetical protein